ncbi:hypothetical protein F5Y07DRAFT_394061 [Xylaria sp. FL0933]|nr:hypothetical protein F5Y07DRAFT_394061 [Xylaria sp. FL0933]
MSYQSQTHRILIGNAANVLRYTGVGIEWEDWTFNGRGVDLDFGPLSPAPNQNVQAPDQSVQDLGPSLDSGYLSIGPYQSEPGMGDTIWGTLQQSSSSTTNVYDNDNKTQYSDARSLDKARLDIYISEFAEELAPVLPQSISTEQLSSLSATLPDLLKSFAVRVGQEGHSSSHYGLMHLVHKYRNQISEAVVDTFANEEQEANEEAPRPNNIMPIQDKMLLWARQSDQLIEDPVSLVAQTDGKNSNRDELNQVLQTDNENEEFVNFPEKREYRDTLVNSRAYSWLLKSVINEIELEIPTRLNNTRAKIRTQVLEIMGEPSRISKRGGPERQGISYRLPWIREYLVSQEYEIPIHQALPRAVVVVGTEDQSFVTTCGEYLGTVWPDIGPQILELYTRLLVIPHGNNISCTHFDNTATSAKVACDGSTVEFYVNGTPYSLAEAGKPEFSAIIHERTVSSPCLKFTFVESPLLRIAGADSYGRCWVNLFGNRPVVGGYPIPRRSLEGTGAEIHLDLMAQLINAKKITNFSGFILIKGYSAVLVPTQHSQGILFWHLIYDPHGDYISYTDPRVKNILKTGSSDANYAIGWSSLAPPAPGFAFEKISISGGMFLTAGLITTIGKRDKAVQLRCRDDYTMRLKWISKKFVVLYDYYDRRAWLLDGASALLHLVRASLWHELNDDFFNSQFQYQESALIDAPNPHGGKGTAIGVLTNPRNLEIPLYAKPGTNKVEVTTHEGGGEAKVFSSTKTNYCLKDRIEDISHALEQIFAHQADTCTQDGVGFKVKASDRRYIEGFDFMDVATDEDPCFPKQVTLCSGGKGWVDFVRSIHAITLFGTSFGELFSPSKVRAKECISCHANMDLPKGQDLLAVCVAELSDILQKRGSKATTPWRLVDDIYWLTPDKTFEPCQSGQKCDRIQVLLPATFPKLWGRNFKSPGDLSQAPRGALIFGHSRRFPLRWGDRGDPEQGDVDHDHELEALQVSIQDSGVGTSLESSSGNGVNSPPSTGSSSLVHERTRTLMRVPEGRTESEPSSKRRKLSNIFSKSVAMNKEPRLTPPS